MKINPYFGPRQDKKPGSVEWCYQTKLYAETCLRGMIWDDLIKAVREILQYKVYEILPEDKPYMYIDIMFMDMGADIKLLREIIDHYGGGDLLTSWDRSSHSYNRGPGKTWDSRTTDKNIVYNVHDNNGRPTGNSQQRGLRRLDKEANRGNKKAQKLQKKVFEQVMSVNAAMIEMGWRTKTITIPLDPERAARSIKNHFSDSQIDELRRLL